MLSFVKSLPQDYILDLPQGQQSVDDFILSRIQEVTVHAMDIAAAIRSDIKPSVECLRHSLYFHADRTIERNLAVELVLALTDTESLQDGFNVFG